MAAEGAVRKLTINPKFIPYLEKHRIYDLLYDLASSLAIEEPVDHIRFLRDKLDHLSERRERPRVIIIAPPHVDRMELAETLSGMLEVPVITCSDFLADDTENDNEFTRANKLKELIATTNASDLGWVLYDFPRDRKEGKAMQKLGVIPTHTFQLVPTPNIYSERDIWNKNTSKWKYKDFAAMMDDYRKTLLDLKLAFSTTIQPIKVSGRSTEQISQACATLVRKTEHRGAPCLQRILLIGNKGCRKTLLADMIKKRFNLVHLDMVNVIARAQSLTSELAETVRSLIKAKVPIYGHLVLQLLEERLLEPDCLKQGWVLTHFPRNVNDFYCMDLMDTPPNKVIFLMTKPVSNLARVLDISESKAEHIIHGIKEGYQPYQFKEYVVSPNRDMRKALAEIENFSLEMKEMLDYCGDNCSIVNAEGDIHDVFERLEHIIVSPPLLATPRIPDLKDKELLLKDLEGNSVPCQMLKGSMCNKSRSSVVSFYYLTPDNADKIDRSDEFLLTPQKIDSQLSKEASNEESEITIDCSAVFPSALSPTTPPNVKQGLCETFVFPDARTLFKSSRVKEEKVSETVKPKYCNESKIKLPTNKV